jgi:RNA polymerase sigma factor (sigma-70 family)
MKEERIKKNETKIYNFVGNAVIYDELIFVDTNTGKGYDKIIKKMDGFINWYSSKIRLSGFEREDIKQLIIAIILDGVRRYDPKYNIKLSTFLYVHIKNRMASRIKEENRLSLNATHNELSYRFICQCGNIMRAPKNDNTQCDHCLSYINNSWDVRLECSKPISLDSLISGENEYNNEYEFSYDGYSNVEQAEKKMDFRNIIKNEDKITRKIAEMVYFYDCSITDAANEVGLSCWATSLRLKKLKYNQNMQDFFSIDGNI